eukprot:maker-scaffold22_size673200-snap-gene-5.35 protein:Tk12694 transcript:maker-scaffold22_size673200-snap-gene-5.35-mRNA-1 annotation:"hypothetical protein TcasGA2_TC008834"
MFSSFFKSAGVGVAGGGSGPHFASRFEKGEEVGRGLSEAKSLFRHFEGVDKSNGQPISLFVCDTPDKLGVASQAVKRLKTLRHPAILAFLESQEIDGVSVSLATERVSVLSAHLDELDRDGLRGTIRDQYLGWGLYQVLMGVHFLTHDAQLRHNGLFGDAIYVNKAGDWKLFALDRVLPTSETSLPAARLPALAKYDSPEVSDPSKARASTPWSRDMWGVGIVIWEVFNGPLPAAKSLGQLGQIPKKLSGLYMELVAANPGKRPNPKEKMRSCPYFKNPLLDTLLFLEELQIKDDSEKNRFYGELGPKLDQFPGHVCQFKILPELLKAFQFNNAGASILGPVFKIGQNLGSEDYVRMIIPCIVKLFASNDRNARFKLLNQVEHFVVHLEPKVVNDEVFPHIQNGFLDQEPIIREKTVISMIFLAPKLSFANLDECAVTKHFSRLLRDEQAGIRTNTTVCLGKIARYLHYSTRQKILIVAFTGKLRDPFPPARIAAINALAATQQYYTIPETSSRVLPALCQALIDPEEPVRKQAFKVVRGFIDKLEQVSNNPSLREEMESEVKSTNSDSKLAAASSWASWAVGAIGAKFYKTANKPPEAVTAANGTTPTSEATVGKSSSGPSTTESSMNESISESIPVEDEGNGWEDNDDDWGSLEEQQSQDFAPPEPSPMASIQRFPKKSTPVESKSSSLSHAWDDFDEPAIAVDRDEEKRLREEKREARKAELAAKRASKKAGPLKLGAKKAVD